MKYGRMKIYHNSEFGFIFCAETTIAGTVIKTVMNPVSAVKCDLTDVQLGKKIGETIEMSRNASPVERSEIKNFKFWHISGIKSFPAFSKKFDGISIFEDDTQINAMQLVRDVDGAYFIPETQVPIKLNKDTPPEEIGREVRKLLTKVLVTEADSTMSFETVYDRKVTYTRPSDSFIDVGDGHTDAYQVFMREENANNVIAFLIDNKYIAFNEQAIRERWEQSYGMLQEFVYRIYSKDHNCKIIEISAKANDREILSNIYYENAGQLEIMAQIDRINTSKAEQDKIRTEYKSLIASIKLF